MTMERKVPQKSNLKSRTVAGSFCLFVFSVKRNIYTLLCRYDGQLLSLILDERCSQVELFDYATLSRQPRGDVLALPNKSHMCSEASYHRQYIVA